MMRRTPMRRSGFKQRAGPSPCKPASPKAIVKKSPGMRTRQRTVAAEEKALWDRLAREVGCIACRQDGIFNDHVSIHHVDGRTKPGCHRKVLPLCGPHHQDDGSGAIAVHPWKARFEARYGTQDELMLMCAALLGLESLG
jgi:hypothetical protein